MFIFYDLLKLLHVMDVCVTGLKLLRDFGDFIFRTATLKESYQRREMMWRLRMLKIKQKMSAAPKTISTSPSVKQRIGDHAVKLSSVLLSQRQVKQVLLLSVCSQQSCCQALPGHHVRHQNIRCKSTRCIKLCHFTV